MSNISVNVHERGVKVLCVCPHTPWWSHAKCRLEEDASKIGKWEKIPVCEDQLSVCMCVKDHLRESVCVCICACVLEGNVQMIYRREGKDKQNSDPL